MEPRAQALTTSEMGEGDLARGIPGGILVEKAGTPSKAVEMHVKLG